MIKIFLFGLIVFLPQWCYSQKYSEKQIDHLLDSIGQFEKDNPNKIFPVSFDCYNASREIDYKKGMAKSLLLSGRGMMLLGQYDEALKYAVKSEAIAGKQCYNVVLCGVCRLEAECYKSLGMEFQEHKLLKRAMTLSESIRDQYKMHYEKGCVFKDLANYYERTEKQDSALVFYEKSDDAFSKMKAGYSKNCNRSLAASGMAMVCTEKKQYDLAAIYLAEAEKQVAFTNCVEAQLKIFRNKARLELAKGNDKAAIDNYQEALALAKKLNRKELVSLLYYKLSMLYEKTGHDDKADQCFLECHKINNHLDVFTGSIGEFPVKLAVKNTEQQIKKSNMGMVTALFFAVVFIVFLIGRIIWYIRKSKEEKQEVDFNGLRLQQKEELLEKAKDVDSITIENIVQLAKEDDPQFLIQFAIVHLNFFEHLTELKPQLKEEEMKICAMQKLGFSVKEIAIITDASVRSVEARIYRVRKRIKEQIDEGKRGWFEML
ncbi:tetratricopeptide repeat protein [Flavobacterium cerinum]|uniref:HTH luxR-type domain-containing protein n=1 Tax=Flavobacterium cerinum TaxID=2502784 RepID=A0ABY5ISV6_9FLAO|nr:hypothetical protein [Flavobacterium cerinum]UUC45893.1 hypothetical protein NOX80_01510 [Flavobacterium cerinum]